MSTREIREDVRVAVYDAFGRTARAPSVDELATTTGVDQEAVAQALRDLHASKDLVLDIQTEQIIMAHPFTSIPLGFSVMGGNNLWWGGCAWDAFAIPHLIPEEPSVLVATTCPACETPLAWTVNHKAPPDGEEVAHFLVPASHMWDDVVHTCRHQRLFCSESCVERWLSAHGRQRGYVLDLTTLWQLARGWYAGRLDRGYKRREPSAASAYLKSVGLSGSFWGLPE